MSRNKLQSKAFSPVGQGRDARAMAETIETLTAARGTGEESAVRWSQLKTLGVVQFSGGGRYGYKIGDDVSNETLVGVDPSTKPTGVELYFSIDDVFIIWDKPRYKGHSITEVYRSTQDDFGTATLIGSAAGLMYVDHVNFQSTVYYWVRHVNDKGVQGPIHATSGLKFQPVEMPQAILARLTDKITKSELHQDLKTPIERVGVLDQAIIQQSSVINGLNAKYTIKLDSGGKIAGFGLASTVDSYDGSIHSQAAFRVDTFSIGAPGADSLSFIVDNGKVLMDAAYITNLVVDSAHINSIGVSKITGVTASYLLGNIGVGNITNAYIGEMIQSNNYSPGVSGWRIHKSGFAEFDNLKARGDIEAASLKAGIIEAQHIKGGAVSHVASSSASVGAFVGVGTTIHLDAGIPAGMTGKVFVVVSFRGGTVGAATNIGANILGVISGEVSIPNGYSNGGSIQGTISNAQAGHVVDVQLTNTWTTSTTWGAIDVSLMTTLL